MLYQYLVKYLAGNISQSVPAAVVEVRQLSVVDAKQMQHRGMQVVNRNAVCDSAETDFIKFTITCAFANSCTRHEHAKPVRVVIVASVALRNRHTAKLSSP